MFSHLSTISDSDGVQDLVLQDYRAAAIFDSYSIDYTNANASLQEVCNGTNLAIDNLKSSLSDVSRNFNISNCLIWEDWKLDFLIEYLKNVHHQYIRKKLPAIAIIMDKVPTNELSLFTKLQSIRSVFEDLSKLLNTHILLHESTILPYIKQVYNASVKRESYGALLVKTLRKPIDKMASKDLDYLLGFLQNLRRLTDSYKIQRGYDIRYNILLQQLNELDCNLLQHIFIQKNVLFPKTLAVEKELIALEQTV